MGCSIRMKAKSWRKWVWTRMRQICYDIYIGRPLGGLLSQKIFPPTRLKRSFGTIPSDFFLCLSDRLEAWKIKNSKGDPGWGHPFVLIGWSSRSLRFLLLGFGYCSFSEPTPSDSLGFYRPQHSCTILNISRNRHGAIAVKRFGMSDHRRPLLHYDSLFDSNCRTVLCNMPGLQAVPGFACPCRAEDECPSRPGLPGDFPKAVWPL